MLQTRGSPGSLAAPSLLPVGPSGSRARSRPEASARSARRCPGRGPSGGRCRRRGPSRAPEGFPGGCPGALAAEALLELCDPGLERRNVLLQLREVALEDLAPAALVGETRPVPAQGMLAGEV